jgi:uncharacterized protein YneR
MSLTVSPEAAKWFKEEMDLQAGDYIQFYVKLYGGIPTVHPNYSLGMSVGQQGTVAIKDEVEGITFYFNEEDAWFLEEYDLKIEATNDDVDYIFHPKK